MSVGGMDSGSGDGGVVRVRGTCHVFFAYDVGLSVDLEAASRLITEVAQRQLMRQRRRAATWFQYEPAPLLVSHKAPPIQVGRFETDGAADCTLYDFGGASVCFRLPIDCPLGDLPVLSDDLYDNDALLTESRRRVDELLATVRPAVAKPGVSPIVEDYAVFAFTAWEPTLAAEDIIDRHADLIARILLGERGELSPRQVAECLASRVAFGRTDAAVVDWHAAAVFDPEPADALAVLEHANVELAEMRLLDGKLDGVLERAHAMLAGRGERRVWPIPPASSELRRLAALQMDAAALFEGVNNAIKLVGDQYLARLYRLAADRLHLPEWDANVLRKLQTADSIYHKIAEYRTHRRMEALEIAIVILIAVSILIGFLPWGGK